MKSRVARMGCVLVATTLLPIVTLLDILASFLLKAPLLKYESRNLKNDVFQGNESYNRAIFGQVARGRSLDRGICPTRKCLSHITKPTLNDHQKPTTSAGASPGVRITWLRTCECQIKCSTNTISGEQSGLLFISVLGMQQVLTNLRTRLRRTATVWVLLWDYALL
jgi:hypothetical protein